MLSVGFFALFSLVRVFLYLYLIYFPYFCLSSKSADDLIALFLFRISYFCFPAYLSNWIFEYGMSFSLWYDFLFWIFTLLLCKNIVVFIDRPSTSTVLFWANWAEKSGHPLNCRCLQIHVLDHSLKWCCYGWIGKWNYLCYFVNLFSVHLCWHLSMFPIPYQASKKIIAFQYQTFCYI